MRLNGSRVSLAIGAALLATTIGGAAQQSAAGTSSAGWARGRPRDSHRRCSSSWIVIRMARSARDEFKGTFDKLVYTPLGRSRDRVGNAAAARNRL